MVKNEKLSAIIRRGDLLVGVNGLSYSKRDFFVSAIKSSMRPVKLSFRMPKST